MGHNASWMRKPYIVPIVVAVIIINIMVALLAAARFRVTSWSLLVAVDSAVTSSSWTAADLSPVFEFSPSTITTPVSSPACVLMTIGDDMGTDDLRALPFSRLYRLFDAAKEEILRVHLAESGAREISTPNLTSAQNSSKINGTSGPSYASRESGQSSKGRSEVTRPVKAIVGLDYASVACKMARDALLQNFRDEFPDMEGDLSCSEVHSGPADLNGNFSSKVRLTLPLGKVECGTVVAGSSAQYVPQINIPLCEIFSWKRFRAVDMDQVDTSRQAPALPPAEWQPTIVTAFSSNHFEAALLLLRSMGKAGKAGKEMADTGSHRFSVVIYALENISTRLRKLLDCVVLELAEKYGIHTEVREFDFSAHPSWMRINQTNRFQKGGTGEYAWKGIIIHSVLVERGFVMECFS